MSDFKERMIEAYERGECGYEEAYEYVRDSMADVVDINRKRDRENAADSTDQKFGHNRKEDHA